VNFDLDLRAMSCERFIDRVIDNLEYHVMQAGAVIRIPDVHARALAYRVQPFEYFNIGGIVGLFRTHGYNTSTTKPPLYQAFRIKIRQHLANALMSSVLLENRYGILNQSPLFHVEHTNIGPLLKINLLRLNNGEK